MELNLGVIQEELLHHLDFVGREIVQYDVDLSGPARPLDQVPEERDEIGAGVPSGSLTLHFPRFYIQGRIERKGPCRSNPCRSARPGDKGNTGSSRSRA
jgi:hypothetical protein